MWDTWVIADTHWCHTNIVSHCNRPEQHNDLMFENWEKNVKPTDEVLHLGDLVWWKPEIPGMSRNDIYRRIRALPGRKRLIKGNNDKKTRVFYERLGFEVIKPFTWERIHFSHRPVMEFVPEWNVNVHGHTHQHTIQVSPLTELMSQRYYLNASVEQLRYTPVTVRWLLWTSDLWRYDRVELA